MKTDARIRYTRMRIREAFFECLTKKQVSKITVKEICDRAEINRATFYKHYADPFDLLQKLEEEALEEIRKKIENRDREMEHGVLLTVLNGLMDQENSYALLASSNGDPGFAARISELFYQGFRPQFVRCMKGCTEAEKDAAYLFVAGGCGHLISSWMKQGMQVSPRQVAEELSGMSAAFLENYKRRCCSIISMV